MKLLEIDRVSLQERCGHVHCVHPVCYSDSVRARRLFIAIFPFHNELSSLLSLESSRSKWLVSVFSGLSVLRGNRDKVG